MNKFNSYYNKSVLNRKMGGKEVSKTCRKCHYEWRGYPNSRCPECGYHSNQEK